MKHRDDRGRSTAEEQNSGRQDETEDGDDDRRHSIEDQVGCVRPEAFDTGRRKSLVSQDEDINLFEIDDCSRHRESYTQDDSKEELEVYDLPGCCRRKHWPNCLTYLPLLPCYIDRPLHCLQRPICCRSRNKYTIST